MSSVTLSTDLFKHVQAKNLTSENKYFSSVLLVQILVMIFVPVCVFVCLCVCVCFDCMCVCAHLYVCMCLPEKEIKCVRV